MRERSELIRNGVKGGMTNLSDIRNDYNSFDDGGNNNIEAMGVRSVTTPDKSMGNLPMVSDPYQDNYNRPQVIHLRDDRTINAKLGRPINPNSDLKRDDLSYSKIYESIVSANRWGVDPYTAIAQNLMESPDLIRNRPHNKKMVENESAGHVTKEYFEEALDRLKKENIMTPEEIDNKIQNTYDVQSLALRDLYRHMPNIGLHAKTNAQRVKGETFLSPLSEEKFLQSWNGTKLNKDTEKSYHQKTTGKGVQTSWYGTGSPTVDLVKNPLYGKELIDIRENVVKKNSDIVRLVNDEIDPTINKTQDYADNNFLLFKDSNTSNKQSKNNIKNKKNNSNQQVLGGNLFDGNMMDSNYLK